jgi:hypothetical protein
MALKLPDISAIMSSRCGISHLASCGSTSTVKKTEAEEYGSSTFGPKLRPLEISFDQWSGQSMEGLLRYMRIYDRALTDDEVYTNFANKGSSK